METRGRGPRASLAPVAWLVVDAAIAAALAGPAEALLLFLVSPDRPLTLRDFLAALVALLPQIVLLFVLFGPALVLAGRALSVGRTTRRGPSLRYVLRFALLDAAFLAAAAYWQWRSLGPLVPEPGRSALALMTSVLVAAAAVLALLAGRDAVRPLRFPGPWLLAVAVGVSLALALAAEMRRERFDAPRPIALPGFAPSGPLLLVEIPGLDPRDVERASRRGETPALDALAARGVSVQVDGAPATDELSLHAGLITGQGPARHGVLRSVRYRPLGDRRSFAVLPRGLLLRPLLRTPLWERRPVDHDTLRAMALPEIAEALAPWDPGVPQLAIVGDPLAWPPERGLREVVPDTVLLPGRRVALGGAAVRACPDPGDVRERFFDPPSTDLPETARYAGLLRAALAADRCALRLAADAMAEGAVLVHVRLAGHGRVAYHMAGYRSHDPARGVTEREIDAFGRALPRLLRELDPAIGALVDAARPRRNVALVSTHGIRARHDVGRLLAGLAGLREPTGSHDGPPPGLAVFAGGGFASGRALEREMPLGSVLPTLLFASGLPVAADMGPVARDVFTDAFLAERSLITVPSYGESPLTGPGPRDTNPDASDPGTAAAR